MKNFKESEFNCDGEIVFDKMNLNFIKKLELARMYSDSSFNINSSWRSDTHNRKVGGSKTSSHLKGLAVDISVRTSREKFDIVSSLLKAGFTRIGISFDGNFIHVDDDMSKSQNVIWGY